MIFWAWKYNMYNCKVRLAQHHLLGISTVNVIDVNII